MDKHTTKPFYAPSSWGVFRIMAGLQPYKWGRLQHPSSTMARNALYGFRTRKEWRNG